MCFHLFACYEKFETTPACEYQTGQKQIHSEEPIYTSDSPELQIVHMI